MCGQCAPKVLEPRIQSRHLEPAPGTAQNLLAGFFSTLSRINSRRLGKLVRIVSRSRRKARAVRWSEPARAAEGEVDTPGVERTRACRTARRSPGANGGRHDAPAPMRIGGRTCPMKDSKTAVCPRAGNAGMPWVLCNQ